MFRGIPVWRFLQGIPVQIEDFDQSEVRHERVAKAVFQFRDAVPAFADEKHAWIEIYGPNTEYGEYEKKGGYKKGDFSIDPWKKGGKEIQYHVDKKIPISTPSRSIHLRRYTTNQKNE